MEHENNKNTVPSNTKSEESQYECTLRNENALNSTAPQQCLFWIVGVHITIRVHKRRVYHRIRDRVKQLLLNVETGCQRDQQRTPNFEIKFIIYFCTFMYFFHLKLVIWFNWDPFCQKSFAWMCNLPYLTTKDIWHQTWAHTLAYHYCDSSGIYMQ